MLNVLRVKGHIGVNGPENGNHYLGFRVVGFGFRVVSPDSF